MPTVPPVWMNAFVDENRRRIELHDSAKFSLGHNAYSLSCRFFVSDDAARNVPAGSIEAVAPPGEQRPSAIVLDQQVHVDEGRGPAQKEKQLLGQSAGLGVEVALEFADQLGQTCPGP